MKESKGRKSKVEGSSDQARERYLIPGPRPLVQDLRPLIFDLRLLSHIIPASRKETQPSRPTTMWSSRRRPTESAAEARRRVNSRSSREGDGSPEGWL